MAWAQEPQPHGMISLNAVLTGQASLDPDHDDQHRIRCGGDPCDSSLQFGSASAGLALFRFIDSTEVFQVGIGWEGTRYHWDGNPYYSQTQFSEGWIQFAAQTTSFEGWTWRSLAQINVDTANWDIGGYGWFQGVIWGRYELSSNCNLHVGGLAMGGLNYGRIYPILGIDYAFPWDLNLRLIFPLEFSLTRQHTPKLRYGIAMRTFFGRNRFSESCNPCLTMQYLPDEDCDRRPCCQVDCQPCCDNWPEPGNFCPCQCCYQIYNLDRGYVEYTNLGLEAIVTWWPFFFTELTASAGVCGTGELKLSDQNDSRRFSRYFDPTGYLQLSLNIYF
jgi:hypothetical protein